MIFNAINVNRINSTLYVSVKLHFPRFVNLIVIIIKISKVEMPRFTVQCVSDELTD